MTEWPVVSLHLSLGVDSLILMLCITLLTNEGCTASSDSFSVMASTVWLWLVKSVSFISLSGSSIVVINILCV